MNEISTTKSSKKENNFVGYDYHSIIVANEMEPLYADAYENFGWILAEVQTSLSGFGTVNMKFKRDRKIRNKAELTRLQRQFDACAGEIILLNKTKKSTATVAAVTIGIVGCAFLAGATFSYLAGMLPLMIILAIPGFLGWILPYFCYQRILLKHSIKNVPLIDKKHDEMYDVCERANELLG